MIDVEKELARRAAQIKDDARKGLRAQAAKVLETSKARAPEQTGALKRSGKVEHTDTGAEVVYGVDYAGTVHEDPASSGYKFLESAAKDLQGEIVDGVAKEVKL